MRLPRCGCGYSGGGGSVSLVIFPQKYPHHQGFAQDKWER